MLPSPHGSNLKSLHATSHRLELGLSATGTPSQKGATEVALDCLISPRYAHGTPRQSRATSARATQQGMELILSTCYTVG